MFNARLESCVIARSTLRLCRHAGQLKAPASKAGAYEWCTGALVSPRHVLTAAHCVYDVTGTHKYVPTLNFTAGLNGKTAPMGTVPWAKVRGLLTNGASLLQASSAAGAELVSCCFPRSQALSRSIHFRATATVPASTGKS